MNQQFLDSVLGRMNGFFYRSLNDKDYTMLHMTDGITRLYGHKVDDIIDNRIITYAHLIHPDDVAAVDNAVVKGLETRTDWFIEYRLRAGDGSYHWVHEAGGGVWGEDGQSNYAEGAVFDIADLHRRAEGRQQFLASAAAQTETMIESLSYLKLLSINAGILAARAGTAGAGFSVLAREMRGLAEQTENAVRQLKQKAA